jgi:hypothetical protein
MATTSSAHYEHHLGRIYSWMVGDIEAALARSAGELDAIGLPVTRPGTALDLGAGIGLHALPLAQRGFSVTAIDSCQQLLTNCERGPVRCRSQRSAPTLSSFPDWYSTRQMSSCAWETR